MYGFLTYMKLIRNVWDCFDIFCIFFKKPIACPGLLILALILAVKIKIGTAEGINDNLPSIPPYSSVITSVGSELRLCTKPNAITSYSCPFSRSSICFFITSKASMASVKSSQKSQRYFSLPKLNVSGHCSCTFICMPHLQDPEIIFDHLYAKCNWLGREFPSSTIRLDFPSDYDVPLQYALLPASGNHLYTCQIKIGKLYANYLPAVIGSLLRKFLCWENFSSFPSPWN